MAWSKALMDFSYGAPEVLGGVDPGAPGADFNEVIAVPMYTSIQTGRVEDASFQIPWHDTNIIEFCGIMAPGQGTQGWRIFSDLDLKEKGLYMTESEREAAGLSGYYTLYEANGTLTYQTRASINRNSYNLVVDYTDYTGTEDWISSNLPEVSAGKFLIGHLLFKPSGNVFGAQGWEGVFEALHEAVSDSGQFNSPRWADLGIDNAISFRFAKHERPYLKLADGDLARNWYEYDPGTGLLDSGETMQEGWSSTAIAYEGAGFVIQDPPEAPVLNIIGSYAMEIWEGDDWSAIDPGATAIDLQEGDISSQIIMPSLNTSIGNAATYLLSYYLQDASGNWAHVAKRLVVIKPDAQRYLRLPPALVNIVDAQTAANDPRMRMVFSGDQSGEFHGFDLTDGQMTGGTNNWFDNHGTRQNDGSMWIEIDAGADTVYNITLADPNGVAFGPLDLSIIDRHGNSLRDFQIPASTAMDWDNGWGTTSGQGMVYAFSMDPAQIVEGYWPIYDLEVDSDATSMGNGTSFAQVIDGVTYYMPNGMTLGVDRFEGDVGPINPLVGEATGVLHGVEGYYPLYKSEDAAKYMSSLNTATSHVLSGVTYYMPDGLDNNITMFLGNCGLILTTLDMTLTEGDVYGDGWNGVEFNIYDVQGGTLLASHTLEGGSAGTDAISLEAGTYFWALENGNWVEEVDFTLTLDSDSSVLASGAGEYSNGSFTIGGGAAAPAGRTFDGSTGSPATVDSELLGEDPTIVSQIVLPATYTANIWVKNVNLDGSQEWSNLYLQNAGSKYVADGYYGQIGSGQATATHRLGAAQSDALMVAADTWYLFTAVYDGSVIEYYVDGVSIGTVDPTLGTTGVATAIDVLNGPAGQNFAGSVRDLRIYDGVKTAAQILESLDYEGAIQSSLFKFKILGADVVSDEWPDEASLSVWTDDTKAVLLFSGSLGNAGEDLLPVVWEMPGVTSVPPGTYFEVQDAFDDGILTPNGATDGALDFAVYDDSDLLLFSASLSSGSNVHNYFFTEDETYDYVKLETAEIGGSVEFSLIEAVPGPAPGLPPITLGEADDSWVRIPVEALNLTSGNGDLAGGDYTEASIVAPGFNSGLASPAIGGYFRQLIFDHITSFAAETINVPALLWVDADDTGDQELYRLAGEITVVATGLTDGYENGIFDVGLTFADGDVLWADALPALWSKPWLVTTDSSINVDNFDGTSVPSSNNNQEGNNEMAKNQRTKVKAEYQIANASDAATREHHFVQADGTTLMDTAHVVNLPRKLVHGQFVADRMSDIVGIPATLSASLAWSGSMDYLTSNEYTVKAALEKLDIAISEEHAQHVAALASQADGYGAGLIGFDVHQGGNGVFEITDGTVQEAIEAIIDEIDVFKSDETVLGSIKATVDDALAAAITGVSADQLSDSLLALSGAFNTLNDNGDTISGWTENLVGILEEMKHDIRDGKTKASEYGTLDKIAVALGVQTELETADKVDFKSAINEVDSHADLAASSMKAGHDFASGAYAPTAGNYVVGATVDAALGNLDAALKASMDAMGLTAGGAFDGLAGQQFIANSDTAEGAFIKLDDVAKNLEDSFGAGFDAANGPWEAPGGDYIALGAGVAASLGDLDQALKLSMDNMGLDSAGVLGLASGSYIDVADSVKGALQVLDSSLSTSMTNMGLESDGFIEFDGLGAAYVMNEDSVKDSLVVLDSALSSSMTAMGLSLQGAIDLTGAYHVSADVSVKAAILTLDTQIDANDGELQDIRAALNVVEGAPALIRKGDHAEEWIIATEGQKAFVVADAVHPSSVSVYRNGLLLREGSAYDFEISVDGLTVTLVHECDADDEVAVKFIKKTSDALFV